MYLSSSQECHLSTLVTTLRLPQISYPMEQETLEYERRQTIETYKI